MVLSGLTGQGSHPSVLGGDDALWCCATMVASCSASDWVSSARWVITSCPSVSVGGPPFGWMLRTNSASLVACVSCFTGAEQCPRMEPSSFLIVKTMFGLMLLDALLCSVNELLALLMAMAFLPVPRLKGPRFRVASMRIHGDLRCVSLVSLNCTLNSLPLLLAACTIASVIRLISAASVASAVRVCTVGCCGTNGSGSVVVATGLLNVMLHWMGQWSEPLVFSSRL